MSEHLSNKNYTAVEIFIHTLTWIFVFISPLFFHPDNSVFTTADHIHSLMFPTSVCIIFYLNYLYLVPQYYLDGKYRGFVLVNLLLILGIMLASGYVRTLFPRQVFFRNNDGPHVTPSIFFWIFIKVRNFLSFAFIAALAVFVSLSKEVRKSEFARKQLEVDHKEAELRNLRNQINPHFLLNTLNNIYALTGFDVEKAQEAILELSKMLRYMLYENETAEVDLYKEIGFLKNYVALMKIRLPKHVEVETNFQVPLGSSATIAPLIFISLVENAFKHGVSSTKACFIRIYLSATEKEIVFRCENSNIPKLHNDKSPGGIGLQQVKNRLELAYAGHYVWEHGTKDNDSVYFSNITISKHK